MTKDEAFERLSRSKFRSRFRLGKDDIAYIQRVGMDAVERHCRDFIRERLSDAEPKNDGRQTPMRGHPVFIAQHACACCCRGCLAKWYRVPMHRRLTDNEQERIVSLLMEWIKRQMQSEY